MKGRLINHVHERVQPYIDEVYEFVKDNIGINLAKYLPLFLIWMWITLKALEDFLMSILPWTYLGLVTITIIVIGRDIYRKRVWRRQMSNEIPVERVSEARRDETNRSQ